MTALLLALALSAAAPPERVTFDEAVRRSLARAPGARLAAEEIARVDGLLGQARASSLPAMGGAASYTRLDADRTTATGVVVTPQDQKQASLALSVPLVAPGRWATWVVASKQLDATRVSEEDVRRQVALAAGRAYLGVLAARRAVEVSRSAVELSRARLDFSRARLKGGVGNALDEARALQVMASSEAQLEAAQTLLARAQEALGLATGGEAPLDAAEDPKLAAPPAAAFGAEERRADVRAARARQEAAATAVQWSWADWLPSLVAIGQETWQSPAYPPAVSQGWQAQLVLTLPILEGGFRLGQRDERRALEREAQVALDASLRQARSDVRVAVEAVQHGEAAFTSAGRAADQAREVLRLTGEAYKAGATNSLDLTTAQQGSRDADLAMVIAEDAVRNARLDLLVAVGLFP